MKEIKRQEVYEAIYGVKQRTQQEAASHLGISVRRLRKLMVHYGIPVRSKKDARLVGEVGQVNDVVPNVQTLPDIIMDLDAMDNPPANTDTAEQYIVSKRWREIELDVSNDQKSSVMITPEMILAIVKAKKYREQ